MKIGILTHQYVSNYGAFLQAYALAKAVAREFPEDTVEIIDHITLKHFIANSLGWFRFYRGREQAKHWRQKTRVPFVFARERKKYLPLSPRCYTAKQINRLQYDVIVVGSDEVWNYKDRKSTAKIKFGHGLTCRNLIAYAPSVGNSRGDIPEYVRSGLDNFRAISVRDELTEKLVKKVTGQDSEFVLDPTFLQEIPGAEPEEIQKPYILFYYCDGLPEHIKEQIIFHARQEGLAVYGAGQWDRCYDDLQKIPTPFEWAQMFRHARFVFTGTFHGAVFSILNRRPFKVYLTNKSRIRKVGTLLRELNIENREIDPEFVFDINDHANEIDYEAVDKILTRRRAQSTDYLRRAIKNV